jgi:hypothetical protein
MRVWLHVKKQVLLVLGWLCIGLGLILLPLPIPLGMPLLLISGVLLLTYSVWIKRSYIRFRSQARREGGAIAQFLLRFERLLRYKKLKRMHTKKLRQAQM